MEYLRRHYARCVIAEDQNTYDHSLLLLRGFRVNSGDARKGVTR
jgi:hypothetical protein